MTNETPTTDGTVTPTEEGTVTPIEGSTEPVNDTTPADGKSPGFGVVLGLVGLLSVVYLVRRNN